MLLKVSRCFGNDSVLCLVSPMICIVPVVHVSINLFIEGLWLFYGNQIRHVCVRMQIVVSLLMLVSFGCELGAFA